jgi:magnesium and cobalt transporter
MRPRGAILARLRAWLRGHHAEPTMHDSIAELVQEAAEAAGDTGEPPHLDRHERVLIANVLHLRRATAYDIMVPRADIIAMRHDVTLEQALQQIRTEGHSRLPVYHEQLDEIVGMVHIKDVFAYVGRPQEFSLGPILRRPLMVAPQIPVLDLLLQMRQARMHLALVIDEYGGIDGLVTIEDLVETIVGDIADEHDEEQVPLVTERADGQLDIDARLPIEDFEQRMGPVLTEDEREADIDTIGGLVLTLAGRVPSKGEVLNHANGVEFQILEADGRRIRRVRVRRTASTPAEAA